jgi:ABC-type nitrate/sulfonate/bicarbonate transport system substrate-binding protein
VSRIIVLLSLNLILPEIIFGAEPMQKIRVGLPSLALTYMPYYVAQEKGALTKAGLEAEYIQMNTGIQPQAVIGGNINLFPSLFPQRSPACRSLLF